MYKIGILLYLFTIIVFINIYLNVFIELIHCNSVFIQYNQFILYLGKICIYCKSVHVFKLPLGIYFEGKTCYVKFYAYMY